MADDQDFLEWLGAGVRRFRTDVFPARRAFFARLANAQSPRALFIACADSRVVPPLFTHTRPGDLFVERNPGAMVPVHGEMTGGVSASIEYAIAILGVRHVVICGHSDCGAVRALLAPESLADVPTVARWASCGRDAVARARARHPGLEGAALFDAVVEENVRVQLENLQTHPSARRALEAGKLATHGWVYRIETGEVRALSAKTGRFDTWPPEPPRAPPPA